MSHATGGRIFDHKSVGPLAVPSTVQYVRVVRKKENTHHLRQSESENGNNVFRILCEGGRLKTPPADKAIFP